MTEEFITKYGWKKTARKKSRVKAAAKKPATRKPATRKTAGKAAKPSRTRRVVKTKK